ncbi:MAG: hypothetical protein DCC71_18020 [Proteobacteria bacterium]|nr:MAG: hypothetical protein DCC71_18020 [Pseudomonadota bacterium]
MVSTDVTTDTVWGDNLPLESQIVLQQPIFVKNGATLTILPGVIVRGQPRSAAVQAGSTAGTPGTLIVTQNGKIDAQGSKTAPIIMTTAATDNDNNGIADDADGNGFEDPWNPGDVFLDDTPATAPLAPLNKAGEQNTALWGGLVILGNAPTNLGDAFGLGFGRRAVEGLTVPGFPVADATYGGVEAHDNSGTLRYVSVRHAGDEIGDGNELNGITLAGVGDGTTIEFAEVYVNFDDGIEWFGGTVSSRYLHVAFAGDDTFDLDQGYTGVNQFLFGVMPFFNENDGGSFGTSSGDKAGEFDGDDFDEVPSNVNLVGPGDAPWPLSNAITLNATIIGSTPDSGAPGSAIDFAPVSAASANRGIQIRSGFAGELKNSIVVNTGTAQGFDVDAGGAPGFTVAENVAAGLVAVYCSTFDDGAAIPAGPETDALNAGNARFAATTDNNNTGAGFPGLVEEDQSFNPTGNAAGKLDATLAGGNGRLNPRPASGLSGIGGCAQPNEYGVDRSATYRGAFIRTASEIWTTDWTVLSIAGLLAD